MVEQIPQQIPQQQPLSERDAIIYVPGLFPSAGDQTADRIGQRLAAAFEVESPHREASYSSAPAFEFSFGDAKVGVVTVAEQHEENATPLVDVYTLDYARSFRDTASKRPPIVQGFIAALIVLFVSPRILRSIFMPSQSLGRRLQAFWAVGLLVLIMVYVGTLGYTAYQAAKTAFPAAAQSVEKMAKAPQQSERTFTLEAVILLLTALGLCTRVSLKDIISLAGMETSGALGYLAFGLNAGAMNGAVDRLLDSAIEQGCAHGIRYKRLHLICYSFGSVITLDSLFPRGGGTPPRCARVVDGLVTIACPFDFIRSYWPKYFTKRGRQEGAPKRWLNIYRCDDILASSFTDGDKPKGIETKDSAQECRPDNLLFGPDEAAGLGGLVLAGFRAHGDYWSKETLLDRNAFNPAVAFLFREHLMEPAREAEERVAN